MWFKRKPTGDVARVRLADNAAKLICGSFSSSNLCSVIGKRELGENWTLDDALAVWYSAGTL